MNNKQLLEMLIECVEESKERVKVMVPSMDYYARSGDCYEDAIDIVNPNWLINALKARLEKE